jgi:hypothetical protein
VLLSVVMTACNGAQPTATDTSAVTVTHPSRPAGTEGSRPRSAAIATGPTEVRIGFFGTICQILRGNTTRAVLMRKEHNALLTVPVSEVTKADLITIWGPASVNCLGNWCTVPLDGWAVRFASNGVAIHQPTVITAKQSFEDFVPHLQRVTGSSIGPTPHHKFDEVLDEALTADPPIAASRISAWVELPTGSFSASPYTYIAKFDPDYEGVGERRFGREILLTTTVDTPTLQVSNTNGIWHDLQIHGSSGLEIRIDNDPKSGSQHFHLHYDLAKKELAANKTERPDIVYPPSPDPNLQPFLNRLNQPAHGKDTERAALALLADLPGCSNSQWP